MVSVFEATSIIESHPINLAFEKVQLENANERVLAEEIVADRDFPPFNRVAMDGIAIAKEHFDSGKREFNIEGVAAAGESQRELQSTDDCFEVMTGAPLPKGTDTVIRYEDLDINKGKAVIKINTLKVGQNIHRQAQDAPAGEVLLEPGQLLSPAEIALISSIGKSQVRVVSFPTAAIISTGNELVDIDTTPLPHQIRRSNSYALLAALKSLGCNANLYHLSDEKNEIIRQLEMIISTYDLIILSGGVSKGKFDFVPQALEDIGIKKYFHRVNQKPGKPFWFGGRDNKRVFALPGNPVSTFMCFYRYIKPWLHKSLGIQSKVTLAQLSNDFVFKGDDLTYFLQVKLSSSNSILRAEPHPGGGSGDFANLKEVNAFMELPFGKKTFRQGEQYPVFPFR